MSLLSVLSPSSPLSGLKALVGQSVMDTRALEDTLLQKGSLRFTPFAAISALPRGPQQNEQRKTQQTNFIKFSEAAEQKDISRYFLHKIVVIFPHFPTRKW